MDRSTLTKGPIADTAAALCDIDRIDPGILLRSGNYFDLAAAAGNPVLIEDIAHALSQICRFNGHTSSFYSVAQHSVMVSQLVPQEHALAGLLHDAAEAYLGDVVRPLKALLADYQAIEARVERELLARFGLQVPLAPCIKQADLVMLATEVRDLMPPHAGRWLCLASAEPLPEPIKAWPPAWARTAFIRRFNELTATRVACA